MSRKHKPRRTFDDLGERFERNILDTPKGKIRHLVLWRHLLQQLPSLQSAPPLNVLDAGCGPGQVAAGLRDLGHHLTLCDSSAEMLSAARERLEQPSATASGTTAYYQASIEEMPERCRQSFDLVLCHAVLEWVSEPVRAIAALAELVRPGGYLSLSFYNRDALIYRNLINGNLRKVRSGDLAGHPGGMTPDNPLSPAEVFAWLEQQGFDIRATAGLRVFYDFIPRRVRERLPLEDIIELELEYSDREPFNALARYIHVVAARRRVSARTG